MWCQNRLRLRRRLRGDRGAGSGTGHRRTYGHWYVCADASSARPARLRRRVTRWGPARRADRRQAGAGPGTGPVGELIVDPAPFSAAGDHPGGAQDAELAGDALLADLQGGGERADGGTTAPLEGLDQPDPGRVGKHMQDRRQRLDRLLGERARGRRLGPPGRDSHSKPAGGRANWPHRRCIRATQRTEPPTNVESTSASVGRNHPTQPRLQDIRDCRETAPESRKPTFRRLAWNREYGERLGVVGQARRHPGIGIHRCPSSRRRSTAPQG